VLNRIFSLFTDLIAAAATTGAGAAVRIKGQNAGSGNSAGGDLVLEPGAKAGSGADGLVVIRRAGGTADSDELQLVQDTTNFRILHRKVGGAVQFVARDGGGAAVAGGHFSFTAGAGGSTGFSGAAGGSFAATAGHGGAASAGTSGVGGSAGVSSGDAGLATDTANGGVGGSLDFIAGVGGQADGSGAGGRGGGLEITGGSGGSSNTGAGGVGGPVAVTGGLGGFRAAGVGPDGGLVNITAGQGGESADGAGGAGGVLTLTGGQGAAGTAEFAAGGAGGAATLAAGTGGAAADGAGGAGGPVTVAGGVGGTGTSADGAGGDVVLRPGAGLTRGRVVISHAAAGVVNVVALAGGAAPTVFPADEVQFWAQDVAAGDARFYLRSEAGAALILGNGTVRAAVPASGAGNSLTLAASAAASGNTAGGDVLLAPGLKAGSGADGKVCIRSPGGVAGTDELQFSHDGSNARIESKDGRLDLAAAGGKVYLPAGTFEVAFGGAINALCPLTVSTTGELCGGPRTPTTLAANTNNYSPGRGLFQRWSASAPFNVTGLSAGLDGEIRLVWNVGTQAITLTNLDAASSAANQWATTTGAPLVLAASGGAIAQYDSTSQKWRVGLL
jgi:hypothetical protein